MLECQRRVCSDTWMRGYDKSCNFLENKYLRHNLRCTH
jgi:hypothetical protein